MAEMLRYKRPHGSVSERKFINRFIRPLGVSVDAFGNLSKQIGDNPNILWSAHTDTVHATAGKQNLDMAGGILRRKDAIGFGDCLGADNGAGVWLLREMILASVPGLYVFHRGEEKGRLGSAWLAKHKPTFLEGITIAIAFDRRGTQSIITHQMCQRSCSDAFARSLSAALGLQHKLDDGGSYTDTASYTHLIPECTNVSVGYEHEHTSRETLDCGYLFELRKAVLAADFSQLVVKRDPADIETLYDDRFWWRGSSALGCPSPLLHGSTGTALRAYDEEDLEHMAELCEDYPQEVAALLQDYGISLGELLEHIDSRALVRSPHRAWAADYADRFAASNEDTTTTENE